MTEPTSTPKPGNVSKDSKDAQVSIQDEKNPKRWFIGSIDQGTTSTRFLIFDSTGSPIASHQMEFKQMYPHSGSVQPHQRHYQRSDSIDRYADGSSMILSRSSSPSTLASKKLRKTSRQRATRSRTSKLSASPPNEKRQCFGTRRQEIQFITLSHGQTQEPKLSFGNSSNVTALISFKTFVDYLSQPIHHHSSSRGCSAMWKQYARYIKQADWCLAPSIHGCCTT